MRRRFVLLGAILVATPVVGLPPAAGAPGDGNLDPTAPERFRVACTGAMATDGIPQSHRADPRNAIAADAVVDLGAMTVSGFGIGRAPVVAVTPASIRFGSGLASLAMRATGTADRAPAATGTIVEGTIDRISGDTRIVVHPAGDPVRVSIAMTLTCVFEAAPA